MIFQVSSSHPLAAALVPCSGHTRLPPTPVPHPRVSKTQLTPNVFKHLDTLLGTSICILTHQIIRDDLKRCQWTRLKTSVGLEEFAGWPRSLPYGSARPRPPSDPTPCMHVQRRPAGGGRRQGSGLNLLRPIPDRRQGR